MTTLKDKEVKLKLTYNNGEINLCYSKDVKEAVLEFEKEYYRLINKYYIVYDNETERIPNLVRKIFGDLEK